jgi:hypothetical protein
MLGTMAALFSLVDIVSCFVQSHERQPKRRRSSISQREEDEQEHLHDLVLPRDLICPHTRARVVDGHRF